MNSSSFSKNIKKNHKIKQVISSLEQKKIKIEQEIYEKKKELDPLCILSYRSILVPIGDINTEEILDVEGLMNSFVVEVESSIIKTCWGLLVDPVAVKDGKYYLFMGSNDYMFYTLYKNNGNINSLWKDKYCKGECKEGENCWFEKNPNDSRRFYTFPDTTFSESYTLCNICYGVSCYLKNSSFRTSISDIKNEYEKRLERITKQEFKQCTYCKKMFNEHTLDEVSGLCRICDTE